MDNPKSLFNNNTKVCENCKRPLPHDYKENLCPRCLDLALFREVKEFIRTHDVNEYEVAEHFKTGKELDKGRPHRVQAV